MREVGSRKWAQRAQIGKLELDVGMRNWVREERNAGSRKQTAESKSEKRETRSGKWKIGNKMWKAEGEVRKVDVEGRLQVAKSMNRNADGGTTKMKSGK